MSNALIDQNMRRALFALSKADGKTLVRPQVSNNHLMAFLVVSGGTDYGNTPVFDGNGESQMFGESSDGSGTLINVYADAPTGSILIKQV